ncbi:DUF6221 family protein [Nocardia wallacei]|uniref:DUF6221 family protein n=1 Tax=Nocardia wallacei TaxID=480035 RepID=UPI002456E138|nr:DUF6221 family protein [Nocardia wallacei]
MTADDPLRRLNAGLAEDERIARAPESWTAQSEDAHGMRRVTVDHSTEYVVACTFAWRGEHVARQDPALTLRRVEAIRKVIAESREAARVLEENAAADRGAEFASYWKGYQHACEALIERLASAYPEGQP